MPLLPHKEDIVGDPTAPQSSDSPLPPSAPVKSQPDADILLLSAEDNVNELLHEILAGYRIDLVTTPAAAQVKLRTCRYQLVVVTNFGLAPGPSVDVVPAARSIPAIFLTGYRDRELGSICEHRQIAIIDAPFDWEFLQGRVYDLIGPPPSRPAPQAPDA
jgi:hypothetical protein